MSANAEQPTIKESEVTEMYLCEVAHLFLRPNQLYRFIVAPDCQKCIDLASHYPIKK